MGARATRIACTMIVLLAVAAPAYAQLLTGRVLEEGTDRGIASVTIELTDSAGAVRASAATDSTGAFRLFAPRPGNYTLRLTHIAYTPLTTTGVEVASGTAVELELRLNPSAVALEPLRVIGRSRYNSGWLSEYYARAEQARRMGFGRIFFRDEVERMHAPYVSSFLQHLRTRGRCSPTLFLDGLEVGSPRELDAMITPDQLEGVELYNNATLFPPRYANRGFCALAMFWTRQDLEGARPLTWKRLLAAGGILAGILLLMQM